MADYCDCCGLVSLSRQDVRRVRLREGAAEDRRGLHRQQHIPTALQGNGHHPHRVLAAGDQQAVHRRPHRLHRGRNPPERDGHVLLDLLHVYDSQQVNGEGGTGHRAAGGGQPRGRKGPSQVSQVLSMGMFCIVLPSHAVLCAALSVENVGRRAYQDVGTRPQLPHCQRGVQARQEETARGLLHHESAYAKLLRLPFLHLRNTQLHQRDRTDFLHGLLSGRRVQHLRQRRAAVHGNGTGRAGRPYGQSVSQGDQMHVPQVRSVRFGAEIRRALRVAAQHRQ